MIAVAMSGGVDSSVAAALLLEAGHGVVGLTLRLKPRASSEEATCCGDDAVSRAARVAEQLGIGHHVVDASSVFEAEVLAPAWRDYMSGRTPSPCLLCNARIKFGALLREARELGSGAIATGHYARIERDGVGPPRLLRGADRAKDQSYFLAGLSRGQLEAARFPLGALHKTEVRERARALGLASRDARDSQDACLVGPDGNFAQALRDLFGAETRPGEIVDDAGLVVGRHGGVHLFTVGQRKGLGVSAASRLWVREIRADRCEIAVTGNETALDSKRLAATGAIWSSGAPPASPLRCEVQVRYWSAPVMASVTPLGAGAFSAEFDAPVRAVTPGQAAVLYDGDRVIGMGWIC